ncbi:hypothetical protein FOL47_010835 [Perkinsus chesapeaki]|uniref:Rab-like protein 2A n=1 Tax=Perkinsus chesapeaki TaxID=330153 RepID=A0A7J6MNT3_PERCH|nr:hypothetical protein FOL47_010835 [Perkinsus chesapeaki]
MAVAGETVDVASSVESTNVTITTQKTGHDPSENDANESEEIRAQQVADAVSDTEPDECKRGTVACIAIEPGQIPLHLPAAPTAMHSAAVTQTAVSASPREYAQRTTRGMGLFSATGIMTNYPTTAPPIVKIIKVVILGDAAVGKTSLIQRYMHGSFSHHSYKPTVGADFYSKKLDVIPDQVAGYKCAERFRSLGASFYRGADACILVCDVSRQNGLKNVLEWRRDFLKHADPDEPDKFPFVFVANKTDLPEHAFAKSDLTRLVSKMREERPSCPDYPIVMASAENGSGVSQVFELAGLAAVQRANENDRRFSPNGLPGDPGSTGTGAIMLANGMHTVARQGTCAGC